MKYKAGDAVEVFDFPVASWNGPAVVQSDRGAIICVVPDEGSFKGVIGGFAAYYVRPLTKEPTDQELADKWREMTLEARNIRRELEAKGLRCQARAFGGVVWADIGPLAAEAHDYRFYKEEVIKNETIL